MPSAARVTLFTVGGAVLAFGVGSVAITGLILVSSHDVWAAEQFEFAGDTLTITSDGGGVHLRPGATAGSVNVDRRTTDSIWGADPEWDMDMTSGTLRLDTNCPPMYSVSCDGDYDVLVPPEVKYVKVRNTNGSVSIDRINALEFDLESDNGSIKVRDASAGKFKLSSDNGSIRVANTWAWGVEATSDNGSINMTLKNAPDWVDASSDNGSLKVYVPADGTKYKLTADSDNGSTNVAEDLKDDSSTRTLDLSSDNGSVTARRSPETGQPWPVTELPGHPAPPTP
ncbi:DUF4097 family beta strand repeat-containing protein [Streptodolium elevatio]|uniref:DUF4097 family beta strand repeat-containing protein n=1 Tax=Streptodolium elevatio TaxID=3157996 RepID=A0ABV3DQD9_9ACTN